LHHDRAAGRPRIHAQRRGHAAEAIMARRKLFRWLGAGSAERVRSAAAAAPERAPGIAPEGAARKRADDAPPIATSDRKRGRLQHVRRGIGWFGRGLKLSALAMCFLVLALSGLVAAVDYLWVTEQDVAYRGRHPDSQACRDQRQLAAILAHERYDDVVQYGKTSAGERKAADDVRVRNALGCVVQEHVIPAKPGDAWPNGKPVANVRYHLAFVEFKENGETYPLTMDGREAALGHFPATQADALKDHLARLTAAHKSNYVIAFVHGWRGDARVGDSNVADLRLYAGHVAAFMAERCVEAGQYCDTAVTAVYLGWRGAWLDEASLRVRFGPWAGEAIGRLAAIPTILTRREVSEGIAPAVVSFLEDVNAELGLNGGNPRVRKDNRMIVLAHSLGAHLVMVGLKQKFLDAIGRHHVGEILRPPVGDLIVLLNPASEAANWTALQKAVQERQKSLHIDTEAGGAVGGQQSVFSIDQPPVLVSISAARTWPAGGLRSQDCMLLHGGGIKFMALSRVIRNHRGDYMADIRYDWATHDLFPAFMGDLRPAADTLDWIGFDLEGRGELGHDCLAHHDGQFSLAGRTLHIVADIMRTMPFQNTDLERTRTIGQLDPPRHPAGVLTDFTESPLPLGTTHELEIESPDGTKRPDIGHRAVYRRISQPEYSDCADVTGWLRRARERRKRAMRSGEAWDSDDHTRGTSLTPVQSVWFKHGRMLSSQFRHGLRYSGIRPISDANDPFWNVRALDTALSGHGGYVTTPLICAINQFVIDDVVAAQRGDGG
jgi:hypothetical protein